MPGPDDVLPWLERYAAQNGTTLNLDELDQNERRILRLEAEVARSALRGLDALLRLYGQSSTESSELAERSPRAATGPEDNPFAGACKFT